MFTAPLVLIDCPFSEFQLRRRKLIRAQTLTLSRTAGLQREGNHSGAPGRHNVIRSGGCLGSHRMLHTVKQGVEYMRKLLPYMLHH